MPISDQRLAAGSATTHNPRLFADVNGDGLADIVGFGPDRVCFALAKGDGFFLPVASDRAGHAPGAGGWNHDDVYPRELADVNRDGAADILGFGDGGTYVSLSNAFAWM